MAQMTRNEFQQTAGTAIKAANTVTLKLTEGVDIVLTKNQAKNLVRQFSETEGLDVLPRNRFTDKTKASEVLVWDAGEEMEMIYIPDVDLENDA